MNEPIEAVYPKYTDPPPVAVADVRVHGAPEAVDNLVLAVSRARLNFADIRKNATGRSGNQSYQYAPLSELKRATEKPLSDEGVVVFQFFSGPTEAGMHRLTTWLRGHGACFESVLEFPAIDFKDPGDCKAWGTLGTYLRRYTYQAILQLDGDLDADEEPQAPKFQGKGGSNGRSGPPAMPERDERPRDEPRAQQRQQPAQAAPERRQEAQRPRSEPPPKPERTPVANRVEAARGRWGEPLSLPAPDTGEKVKGIDQRPMRQEALLQRENPKPAPAVPDAVAEGAIPGALVDELMKLVNKLGLKGPAFVAWMQARINKTDPTKATIDDCRFLIQSAKEELGERGAA